MSPNRSAEDVWVALLRGINVGGKNRLPMKDLAAMFVDAGCDGVRTYIQSGNVVFRADPALADEIPTLIGASIQRRVRVRDHCRHAKRAGHRGGRAGESLRRGRG